MRPKSHPRSFPHLPAALVAGLSPHARCKCLGMGAQEARARWWAGFSDVLVGHLPATGAGNRDPVSRLPFA